MNNEHCKRILDNVAGIPAIDTINTSDFCELVAACRPYGQEGVQAHKRLVAHIDAAIVAAREQAMQESYQAAIELSAETITDLRARLAAHEAARMAYASEFPLNDDGEPDVGSIHANIRALKARLAAPEGPVAITDETALNGIKWYATPPAEMRNGVNLYAGPQAKAPQQPPAGALVQTYTCIGKGGSYALLGLAKGSGTSKLLDDLMVYQDRATGALYFRTTDDFNNRMEVTL